MRDTRHRMQVAGDFAISSGRQMTERQCVEQKHLVEHTAYIRRRFRIVIAGGPYPVAAALERTQRFTIVARQPRRTAAVNHSANQRKTSQNP